MKPSNKERREVAVMLRCDVPTECNMTDGELLDEITDIIMPRGSSYSSVEEHDAAFVNRLADLIEPEEHELTIADNLALIDRNRELECELADCKSKLGAVSRIADELHGDAASELDAWGDIPLPKHVMREVAAKFGIAGELKEALK